MTETLSRPSGSAPRPPRRTPAEPSDRGPLSVGGAAAVWSVVAGLLVVCLPVLLFWAVDDRSGAGAAEALRSGGRLWLVAHGVNLELPDASFALTPLGLVLVPVALVARFTRSAGGGWHPTTLRAARSLALATALPYALLVAVVAAVTTNDGVHVSPVQALLCGLGIGLAGATAGALRVDRLWRAAWHALPARAQRLSAAAGAATLLLLGAGAALVTASLVVHFSRAADLAAASSPGVLGGLALLLASLSLLPNAVVWGASWLAGPGFALGVGTAVGPFGHELGPVPALPLLAALPGSGVSSWLGVLALVVPLGAGVVAGRLVHARLDPELSAARTAVEAAAAGPVCGVVLGLLAWLSGGAAGGERLLEVGPAATPVAVAVSAAVALGAALAALLQRRRAPGAEQPA